MSELKIDPHTFYWAGFNRFEILFPGWAVLKVPAGGDAQAAVESIRYLIRRPKYCTQASLAFELQEYGAWSHRQLEDDAQNWERILWLGALNIREDPLPCIEQQPNPSPDRQALDRRRRTNKPINWPFLRDGMHRSDGQVRGALMGRQKQWHPELAHTSLKACRVHLEDGYDEGGAYWGCPENLWCAYAKLGGDKEQVLWQRCTYADELQPALEARLGCKLKLLW